MSSSQRQQHSKERGHSLKLVHMVGSRVARESEYQQAARARLAQLLHAVRAPAKHGLTMKSKQFDQVIGGLGGTGERSREDLGVRDEKSLLAAHRGSCELDERLQRFRIQLSARREYGAAGQVASVKSIQEQYGIDVREVAAVSQDRANGSVAGAEPHEGNGAEGGRSVAGSHRGTSFARDARQQRVVDGGIAEGPIVHARPRGETHDGDDIVALELRHRVVGNERGAVEVDDQMERVGVPGAIGDEDVHRLAQRAVEGAVDTRELAGLDPLVCAGVLHHWRRVLRGGRRHGVLRRERADESRRERHGERENASNERAHAAHHGTAIEGVALDMAPALDGTTSSDGWQTATYFCILVRARGYKHGYKDGYLLTQRAIGQRSRSWFGTTRLTP